MKKAILLCLLLAGCATTDTFTKYPAKPPGAKIEVININQIQRKYEIIGHIVSGGVWLGNSKDIMEQARKMGADAISIPETLPSGYMTAEAIKYK